MNIAIIVTLFGLVGGGVGATLKIVSSMSAKWGTMEERVKNIAEDVSELKESQNKLREWCVNALQYPTGRR